MRLTKKTVETDILIIGGGTAGCFAALAAAQKGIRVLIAEKANIRRSGCLAAGVNALNAYIGPGESPESYLDYVRRDAQDIIREDLVLTMAQRLNRVTAEMEKLGLVILKNQDGSYAMRGRRNVKINGENIKPLLADAVLQKPNITVVNHVNITDLLLSEGRAAGAAGFSLDNPVFYAIHSNAVICTTGGAAGLYRPNNPGFSRHKMWYCPFDTGAGYAMGIRAGAEMTTFEMRFIALRCKDTIAPTGTIAQGVGAPQVNSKGELYQSKYGQPSTSGRLYSTVMENEKGSGPCYLKTEGISRQRQDDLYRAYLNMAPAQTLRWMENGGPARRNVEIEGTEPYVVGGHTASGYWVDTKRQTTIPGLFAAGDVAGGCPQKYVTGAFAEGEIAAESAVNLCRSQPLPFPTDTKMEDALLAALEKRLEPSHGFFDADMAEEAMQKVMDEYAGGISQNYVVCGKKLELANQKLEGLSAIAAGLHAENMEELSRVCSVIDRLCVCRVLVGHLAARRETRWHCFDENADYREKDNVHFLCYVNSKLENGRLHVFTRPLVKKEERYEHQD